MNDTQAQFNARVIAQGFDVRDLAFTCPACRRVQSIRLFRYMNLARDTADAKSKLGKICISRELDGSCEVDQQTLPNFADYSVDSRPFFRLATTEQARYLVDLMCASIANPVVLGDIYPSERLAAAVEREIASGGDRGGSGYDGKDNPSTRTKRPGRIPPDDQIIEPRLLGIDTPPRKLSDYVDELAQVYRGREGSDPYQVTLLSNFNAVRLSYTAAQLSLWTEQELIDRRRQIFRSIRSGLMMIRKINAGELDTRITSAAQYRKADADIVKG